MEHGTIFTSDKEMPLPVKPAGSVCQKECSKTETAVACERGLAGLTCIKGVALGGCYCLLRRGEGVADVGGWFSRRLLPDTFLPFFCAVLPLVSPYRFHDSPIHDLGLK